MKKILAFGTAISIALVFIVSNITVFSMYIDERGYAMPQNQIEEIIMDGTVIQSDNIVMIEVEENQTIYEKSGKYYTEDNKQIDLSYPMIIRDGSALKFAIGGSYLVTTDFFYAGINDGSTIVDQTHFNKDGIAVDNNEYMLTQLRNGLYIANTTFEFQSKLDTIIIEKNSIIYFGDSFVNIYKYSDGRYEYNTVRGLQNTDVTFNGINMEYQEFYDLLHKVSERIKKDIELKEESADKSQGIIEDFVENEGDMEGANAKASSKSEPLIQSPELEEGWEEESSKKPSTNTSGNAQDGLTDDMYSVPVVKPSEDTAQDSTGNGESTPYIKPTVTVSAAADLIPWVYTIDGDILIEDKAGRILGGVYFNVYDESGKLVVSQAITASGFFEIGPLQPDTVFAIEAYYEYYDENNEIQCEYSLELSPIKTLPFEGNIGAVGMDFVQEEYSSSKHLAIKDLGLTNPVNESKDVLQYIYALSACFSADTEEDKETITRINTNQLTSLKNNEQVDYMTAEVLNPDTLYSYEFIAVDRYNNEFPITNNYSGTYKTCKIEPKVVLNSVSTGIGNMEIDLSLQDTYEALDGGEYTLTLYYLGEPLKVDYVQNGKESSGVEIKISALENTAKVLIKNLPYSLALEAKVTAKYDLQDGQGVQSGMIGTSNFYSPGIPAGTINLNNSFIEIGGTTVTVETILTQNSTTTLSPLLTNYNMKFSANGKDVVYNFDKTMIDAVDVEANYDHEEGALIVQTENRNTLQPGIRLYAEKETIETYGAWQTFLNTGLFGLDAAYSGSLVIELSQLTLESGTAYTFTPTMGITNIGIVQDIATTFSDTAFTTLKQEPIIYYSDYFVSGNFIEMYDIQVLDEQNAISGDSFIIQIWEDNFLIDSEIYPKNTVVDVWRSDLIREGYSYELRFVAPEYNLTPFTSQAKQQYSMLTYKFVHEEGLRASINFEGLRYAYGGIDTSGDYGYLNNNYTINKAFDRTTNTVVDKEGYFITDYLTYKANGQYYSVFKDFVSTNDPLILSFYDSKYNLIGSTITTDSTLFAHIVGITPYTYSTQFYYTNAAYVRVNGTVDKLEAAYYYQYQEKDTEVLVDVKDTTNIIVGSRPQQMEDDVIDSTKASSDFVDCTAGETLNFVSNTGELFIFFYDSQGVYLANYSLRSGNTGAWVVPTGATQFRVYFDAELLDSKTSVYQITRVKGSNTISPEATIKWSLEDDNNDFFYVLGDNNANTHYTVSKYVNEITVSPSYDNPEYVRKQQVSADKDGSIHEEVTAKESLNYLKSYQYELAIEYNGRYVVLDTLSFDTNGLIYLVRTSGDLDMIHVDGYGQYVVMNDIIEHQTDTVLNRYFGGILDFQGYSYTMNYRGTGTNMFNVLYQGGIIKNGEIIVQESVTPRVMVNTNYGNIENMKFTYHKSIANPITRPMVSTNTVSGVIDNFVLEFNGPTMLYSTGSGILTTTNNGLIRNGYTYNTDPEEGVYIYSSGGVLSYTSSVSSTIESVYADLDLYWNYLDKPSASNWYSGIISAIGTGKFNNMYGVSTRYEFSYDSSDKSVEKGAVNNISDALFGHTSVINNYNNNFSNVYVANHEESSNSAYTDQFDISLLYDTPWSEKALNTDSNFRIGESIMQGFYPILNMDSSIFYSQPYRLLPELEVMEEPQILNIELLNEAPTYVDVEVIFNNPSKLLIKSIEVDNLTTLVTNQITRDDLYVVTLRLSNPQEYYKEYQVINFVYQTGISETTVYHTDFIEVNFYYPIYSIDDLAYVNENPTINARLMNDLDFTNFTGDWNDVRISEAYSGTFDGTKFDVTGEESGNYKIKNINLSSNEFSGNGLFFANIIGGSVSNIDFENIEWDNSSGSYASLIHWATRTVINNVYLNNISLTASRYVAPLAYSITGTEVQNTGIINANIYASTDSTAFGAAGMIGVSKYSIISNSFVSNLYAYNGLGNISTSDGIGGILGETLTGQTRIINCYATGYIENPCYNGGIVAQGIPYINQCYSDVGIVSKSDYNGGISGSPISSNTSYLTDAYILNSFSIGNILVLQNDISNTHRISVVKNWDANYNNFAYKGQLINNEDIGNDDASGLITYTQLTEGTGYLDIAGLGDAYDYSENYEGATPKLYSTEGELLNYQSSNYLVDDNVKASIVSTEIVGSDRYLVDIKVQHGNHNLELISIEGMQLVTDKTVTKTEGNHTTYYQLELSKTQASDYYILNLTLRDIYSGREVEIKLTLDFGTPLYWEITNMNEWQEFMGAFGQLSQNFKIIGELDFSTISNPVTGVRVARLIGDDTIASSITGYNITDSNKSRGSLISNIEQELGNLTFENNNVNISTDSGSSNIGLIGEVGGDITNVAFIDSDISIGTSSSTTVGFIKTTLGNIYNLELLNNNIKITTSTNSFIGMIGNNEAVIDGLMIDNCNIDITNLNKSASTTMADIVRVGMIASAYDLKNVSINNSSLHTYSSVFKMANTGMLVGYTTGDLTNITLDNSEIQATNLGNVGGILGYGSSSSNLANIHVNNTDIKGSYNVGGLGGYLDSLTNTNLTIKNSSVESDYTLSYVSTTAGFRIGGIAGRSTKNYDGNKVDGYSVENVTVSGMHSVGGAVGYGGANNTKVNNVNVYGNFFVGGIIGNMDSTNSNLYAYNVKVHAESAYAGGIAGRTRTMTDVHVFDSEISGGEAVGGMAGRINTEVTASVSESSVHGTTVSALGFTSDGSTQTGGTHAGGLIGIVENQAGESIYNIAVIDTHVSAERGYAGGLFGELRRTNAYQSYVVGGSVTSNNGNYVGGIAGKVDMDINNSGNLYSLYSATNISGNDYIGGIFGWYTCIGTANNQERRQMYNLQTYGDISGNDHIYGIGYIDPEYGIASIGSYFGGLVAYEGITLGNGAITQSSMSNISNNTVFSVVSKEELTSYTKLTTAYSSGGMGSTASTYAKHLGNAAVLDPFDIVIQNITNQSCEIKLTGVQLNDGSYYISISNGEGGSVLVNRQSINVNGNTAIYNLPLSTLGNSTELYIQLHTVDGTYGAALFEGIDTSYTYTSIAVNGIDSSYYRSDNNETLTLKVNESGAYTWYRIYEGQGYATKQKLNVSTYADGNTLVVDIPGIYYAVNEATKTRTTMFVYETNTYYPFISTSTGTVLPFQSGYMYTDTGIVDLTTSTLELSGKVFEMVSRQGINDSVSGFQNPVIELDAISYQVYGSGVDSINIEFNEEIQYSNDNNQVMLMITTEDNQVEYPVSSRVMTFGYNFEDDITITLLSKGEELSSQYNSTDLANLISVYGDAYYYQCLDGVANDQGDLISGEFVSVYQDMGMDVEGRIYDLSNHSILSVLDDHLELRETKALYESEYSEEDSDLATYLNFTYNSLTENELDVVVFSDMGEYYALDGSTQRNGTAIIADFYLDEKYTAYLSGDGEIIEVNSELNKPEDFKNYGISEISDTFASNSSVMLVRYDHGETVAFDYVSGDSLELEYQTSELSIVDYGKIVLNNLVDSVTGGDSYDENAYQEAQNFIVQLEETSTKEIQEIDFITQASKDYTGDISELNISEILTELDYSQDTNTSNEDAVIEGVQDTDISNSNAILESGYISIYNPNNNTYETFSVDELVMNDNQVVSVEEKVELASQAGYEGTLNNMVTATKILQSRKDEMDLMIYLLISIGVASLLIVLSKKRKA